MQRVWVHSGQPADPSNDADRAIAGRKTGAAIQCNAKYKYESRHKYKRKRQTQIQKQEENSFG